MSKSSYLPTADGDFLIWHNHFTSHLTEQQAALGLSNEELALVVADNQKLNATFTAAAHAAAVAKQATAEKALSRDGAESNTRAIVRRIKAGANYTKSVGELLRIEGAEDTTDLTAMKPNLSATDLGGGKIQLAYNKYKTNGVNIYSKRESDDDFSFLARSTVSPYVDSRPVANPGKAETRKYKAVYVLGDNEIGQFSDQVNIALTV
jgi:hypothetical protein